MVAGRSSLDSGQDSTTISRGSIRGHAGFPQYFSAGFTSDHNALRVPSIHGWYEVKTAKKVKVEIVEIQREL